MPLTHAAPSHTRIPTKRPMAGLFFQFRAPARIIAPITILVLMTVLCAPASAQTTRFCPGERLVYDLKWGVVPAGVAMLEIMPPTEVRGLAANHFRMTVRTNSFTDVFFKVRNRIDSFTDPGVTRSILYLKRQREGSYKRDITVRFFAHNSTARYENILNGPKEPIMVLPGTFDPLSVFYALRRLEPDMAGAVRTPVSDGVKAVIGEARILGREIVTVPAGTFETLKVAPDLSHIGGVFKKSPDAAMHIWVTDDDRRMPVRVSTKVVVGSFHAELRRAELPACGPGRTPEHAARTHLVLPLPPVPDAAP